MDLSDEGLMQEVKKGKLDQAALLFERYHREIFNFFYKYNRDQNVSADWAQSVFYRILKYRHSYREGQAFRPWLYQIARNVRIDAEKKRSKFSAQEVPESLVDSQQTLMEKEENFRQLQTALKYLSNDKKEIILLGVYQNIAPREIAQILGISENNARVKLHRAIQDLKRIYKKLWP